MHHIFVQQTTVSVLDLCKTTRLMCVLIIPTSLALWHHFLKLICSFDPGTMVIGRDWGHVRLWINPGLDSIPFHPKICVQFACETRILGLFRLYSCTPTWKDLVIQRHHPTRNETTALESWNKSPGSERDGCGARSSDGIDTWSCIPANQRTRDGQSHCTRTPGSTLLDWFHCNWTWP
jgi:hypothetical protein